MVDNDIIKKHLKDILKKGIDYADIFIEESKSLVISCEDNKIEKIISGNDKGIGIRTISKNKTEYSYTNNLTDFFSQNQIIDKSGEAGINLSVEEKVMPVRDISNLVNIANKVARAYDSRIKQVSVSYFYKNQNVLIANSFKNIVKERRIWTIFSVNVIASENNIIQTGFETLGKSKEFEFNPEEIATRASQRAILMLNAKHAPAESLPVILDKSAGGTMIHEAIGHSLEADLVQKGMSKFAGRTGEKVASSIVTVVDDPTICGEFGSYNFDDEGNNSKRTVLVDRGILVNYLYDIDSSMKEGKKTTGNGRRESYQHRPIPRMSNTFIMPGTSQQTDIIKQVKKGLYIKKMGGGQVNPVTSDFVFDVKEGYIIENGEITYPVRGAILTGNGVEILKKIEMIGNELEFMPGRCGKDGQLVPVGDAEPTMLISEIVIGGTKI